MKLTKRRCKVCGHRWIPRRERPPVDCPKCRSRKWKDGKKR